MCRNPLRPRSLFGLAVSVLALSASAHATETVVQNDAVTGTSDATPCQCFIPGDIPAAWLTMPGDGTLVGVQVFWQSPFGGQSDSQEMAVHIYTGGSFPSPGAALSSVVGPVLSDGVFNEFRFEDPPTNGVPVQVPVSAGQTIVVGLEILNQSSGQTFAASTSYDQDGCQANRNAVFTDPGGWGDACAAGVTGDWAIRAILVADNDVPAVSTWGLATLALLLLAAGSMMRGRLHVRSSI